MLVLLVLLLAAAAVCARLGVWQLDRAQIRGEANARAQADEVEQEPPVPLEDVLRPQSSFAGDLVGRKVVTTGTFEDDELVVPGRSLGGRTGFLVLNPLRLDDPADAGSADTAGDGRAVLPVVRGWVPDEATAAGLDPVPTGTVQVTGYLQSGEAGSATDLPEGQVGAVAPGELVNRWGGPIYSGYLVVSAMDPAQDDALALLPPPTVPGGGLNVQNLGYALQWWIFGGFAVLLWVRLVRDETRAAAEGADDAAGPGVPATADAATPDETATGDAATPDETATRGAAGPDEPTTGGAAGPDAPGTGAASEGTVSPGRTAEVAGAGS